MKPLSETLPGALNTLIPSPASPSASTTSTSDPAFQPPAPPNPLAHCPTCGEPTCRKITILGRLRIVPLECSCQRAEWEERKAEEARQKQQRSLQKLQRHSLMDGRFEHCTLANWDDTLASPRLKKITHRYITRWPELKESNTGLLLHGRPGTGKTYAAFTVANELIRRHQTVVIAISAIGLLARIKETYAKYGQEAEIDIINALKNAALLIIDDLGAEQKTDWSTAMLYQIIDSRYRSAKPLFITTNLSLPQLRARLTPADGVDRTCDRLLEVCLPLEITGANHRAAAAAGKRRELVSLFTETDT